jgi:hypothetical protein
MLELVLFQTLELFVPFSFVYLTLQSKVKTNFFHAASPFGRKLILPHVVPLLLAPNAQVITIACNSRNIAVTMFLPEL